MQASSFIQLVVGFGFMLLLNEVNSRPNVQAEANSEVAHQTRQKRQFQAQGFGGSPFGAPYVLNPALSSLYAPWHPKLGYQHAFGPEVGFGGGFNIHPDDPFKEKISFGGDFDLAIPQTFGFGVDPGTYPINLFGNHLNNVQNYRNVDPAYLSLLPANNVQALQTVARDQQGFPVGANAFGPSAGEIAAGRFSQN